MSDGPFTLPRFLVRKSTATCKWELVDSRTGDVIDVETRKRTYSNLCDERDRRNAEERKANLTERKLK